MDYVFTLVHGTWFSRPAWTQEGSLLRTHLQNAYAPANVSFNVFRWSARNSPIKRRAAANELARCLHDSINRHPQAAHYIIAHSHGGNVATLAVSGDALLRSQVRGITCLSTPFLAARPRPFTRALTGFSIAWFALALLISLVDLPATTPLACLSSVVVCALIYATASRSCERILAAVRQPHLAGLNLLLVRTAADETSGVFAAGHILGWVSSRFSALVPWLIRRVFVAPSAPLIVAVAVLVLPYIALLISPPEPLVDFGILLYGLATLFQSSPSDAGGMFVARCLVLAIPLLGFSWLAAVNALILMAGSLSFGIIAACSALRVELTAEAAPEGTWKLHQIGFSDERPTSLAESQHSSSYSDPRAVRAVCDWIHATQRLFEIASESKIHPSAIAMT